MDKALTVPMAAPYADVSNAKNDRWAGLAAMAVAGISDGMEGGLVNTLFPVIMKAPAGAGWLSPGFARGR